ncbi:MerR family transcriptional regulator [Streptacidiphilus sp. N1-3]|uniref:MerR family transcriptional regulator n=1 Tax=Streptacidiphilus alkalitolerans TaxID=3342712 RepID=A0ABV6WUB7_9ACTN
MQPTPPPRTEDPLLSIGVFARRSRLSHKALRLYDRQGLLVPADVDPASGYRRYRESQLATARLIVQLRRLDMPLAAVAAVAAAPATEAAALVRAYWDGVEREFAGRRWLALHLSAQLSGSPSEAGDSKMFTIEVRDVPAQQVLTEQRHVTAADLPRFIGEAMGRLIAAAEPFGGMAGPGLAIYHGEVNEDSDGPVEICIPVAVPPGADTTRVALREEPAHREAYTRISKAQVAFPQILSAYDAVSHWLTAEGSRASDSPREVYFADWDAAGPEDPVCDIAFPIGE